MSNKTQLQTNNTALDGYITRINAAKEVAAGLPEAGGGENLETCTLQVSCPYGILRIGYTTIENNTITAIVSYYIDGDTSSSNTTTATITALKNSMATVTVEDPGNMTMNTTTDGCSLLDTYYNSVSLKLEDTSASVSITYEFGGSND